MSALRATRPAQCVFMLGPVYGMRRETEGRAESPRDFSPQEAVRPQCSACPPRSEIRQGKTPSTQPVQPRQAKQALVNVQKYCFHLGKTYSYFMLNMVKSDQRQHRCIPPRLVRDMLVLFLPFPRSALQPISRICKVPYLSQCFHQHW